MLCLKNYIIDLYKKYFTNIVFIYPSATKELNSISCKESHNGFYIYKCLKKVYNKYPYYKGYLYINDDLFLKSWELINLNFSIPWHNPYFPISKGWCHYHKCFAIYQLFNQNPEWKNNSIEVNGYFDIMVGFSDFYYLPNHYVTKIIDTFDKMYKSKIFLECAVPNSIGTLLASKYQIVDIRALWSKERNKVINYLFSQYDQILIHPMKFSNEINRQKLIQYIFFINANDY